MERLTFDRDFCDIAKCDSTPGGTFCESGTCSQRKVWERLKAIEDVLGGSYDLERLRELLQGEKYGRLVVLPCKASDKLYVVGGKRIIRCDICETYLDDKKGPEYLVSFYCDNDCDGCPFNNWKQDYSGEWSCDGEYGQSVVVGSDIGKTVFLTREEAEAALKGEDHAESE